MSIRYFKTTESAEYCKELSEKLASVCCPKGAFTNSLFHFEDVGKERIIFIDDEDTQPVQDHTDKDQLLDAICETLSLETKDVSDYKAKFDTQRVNVIDLLPAMEEVDRKYLLQFLPKEFQT